MRQGRVFVQRLSGRLPAGYRPGGGHQHLLHLHPFRGQGGPVSGDCRTGGGRVPGHVPGDPGELPPAGWRDAESGDGAVHRPPSGGNAGLSAAYAGRKSGIPVTVVVPDTTDAETIGRLRQEGAEAIVYGSVWDEADEYARQLAERVHGAYIPPFDHPLLWKGHSTIVDELAEQCQTRPDCIILSVGGGGLFCGVMEGLLRHGWENTTVIAVETEGAASLHAACQAGHLVTLDGIHTLATSLGAKRVAAQALDYALHYKVISYTVSDAAAARACVHFADEFRTLIEPACGVSLSLVYDDAPILHDFHHIVVEACGGAKISLRTIEKFRSEYMK